MKRRSLVWIHLTFFSIYLSVSFVQTGTSERTKAMQDNRINGSCISQPPDFHPLKLKIYKCAQDDPDPRCKIECKNMDCYLEGKIK